MYNFVLFACACNMSVILVGCQQDGVTCSRRAKAASKFLNMQLPPPFMQENLFVSPREELKWFTLSMFQQKQPKVYAHGHTEISLTTIRTGFTFDQKSKPELAIHPLLPPRTKSVWGTLNRVFICRVKRMHYHWLLVCSHQTRCPEHWNNLRCIPRKTCEKPSASFSQVHPGVSGTLLRWHPRVSHLWKRWHPKESQKCLDGLPSPKKPGRSTLPSGMPFYAWSLSLILVSTGVSFQV